MIDLHVERLTLRLAGRSEADGRRLARLVAERLAAADLPGLTVTADRLHVSIAPDPNESLEVMARRISDAVIHALARLS